MSEVMEHEINAAVKWWTDQLRGRALHDNGDFVGSALAGMAANNLSPLSEEVIAKFSGALRRIYVERNMKDFRPDQPEWGGYTRVLATDYGPDGTLGDALNEAGIDNGDLRLPIKTIMWIDPGNVCVSRGYGASPVVLFARGSIAPE